MTDTYLRSIIHFSEDDGFAKLRELIHWLSVEVENDPGSFAVIDEYPGIGFKKDAVRKTRTQLEAEGYSIVEKDDQLTIRHDDPAMLNHVYRVEGPLKLAIRDDDACVEKFRAFTREAGWRSHGEETTEEFYKAFPQFEAAESSTPAQGA